MQLWYLHFLVGLRTLVHVVHGQPCASQFKPANTTLYGFSQRCSTFSVLGEEIIGSIMPSGAQMYFKISTFYHECAGYGCLQSYPICSQNCPCCKPYMGDDPGFSANISAPNNESSKYMQNLNCIIPVYVPVPTGIYFISCNFSGYAMANTSKLIQLQLFWNSMIVYYGPLTTNVYITAGTLTSASQFNSIQLNSNQFVLFLFLINWIFSFFTKLKLHRCNKVPCNNLLIELPMDFGHWS